MPKDNAIKKVFLTLESMDPKANPPDHSIPILLAKNKMILLKEDIKGTHEILQFIAQDMSMQFCQPDNSHINEEVFQIDNRSCRRIAVGILEDLTIEDMAYIVANIIKDDKGNNIFTPYAKILKYCQSVEFVQSRFNDLSLQPIDEKKLYLIMSKKIRTKHKHQML